MHIPYSDTSNYDNADGIIRDYEINAAVGVSYQELRSRGPGQGRYLNKEVHEVYFVIDGTAKFVVGNETYAVAAKDVVVVEPGTPHHIEEPVGLRYITITRPDWYESQAEIVA